MPVGAVMLGFQTKKKNGELHNRKSSILFFYYNYAFCEAFYDLSRMPIISQ